MKTNAIDMAERGPVNPSNHENTTKSYYFEEYLKKKRLLQKQIDKNNSSQATQFRNALKVHINTNKIIKCIDIYNAIKSVIGSNAAKIKTLMQFRSNKSWVIEFIDEFDISSFINKEIKLFGNNYKLRNANEEDSRNVELTAVLRIYWLPTHVDTKQVNRFISDSIDDVKIESEEFEKYQDAELCHMQNGIRRLKIKLPLSYFQSLVDLIGTHNIIGHRVLIQLSGYSPKCLQCKNFGHISANCPKNYLKCSKCNSTGDHSSDNCNLANRIRNKNNLSSDDRNYEISMLQESACTSDYVSNEIASVEFAAQAQTTTIYNAHLLQTVKHKNSADKRPYTPSDSDSPDNNVQKKSNGEALLDEDEPSLRKAFNDLQDYELNESGSANKNEDSNETTREFTNEVTNDSVLD